MQTISGLFEDAGKTCRWFDSYSEKAASEPCPKVCAVACDQEGGARENGGCEDMLILLRQRRRVHKRRRTIEYQDANSEKKLGKTLALLRKG